MYNDDKLFEMLILEGMQAGLSWITILRKRETYRKAFDGFDIDKILLYDDAKIKELMQNAGIIRNRLKTVWFMFQNGEYLKRMLVISIMAMIILVGLKETAEFYDKTAPEESVKMEDALMNIAVENEPNPVRVNWNC